jgi:winged helix domain-containing protein/ATPase family protein associated with various cellular activities (AAA)
MSETTVAAETPRAEISWREAHRAWLDAELQRLRLRLHQRVLWLRRQWKHDPLQAWQGMVISDAQADSLLAGEDVHGEAIFYREDPDAAVLGAALDDAKRRAADLRRALTASGAPSALDLLAGLLELSPLEQDVLLLALAPELDPAFERLYAYVQDDVARKYPTPHLALSLFGGDPDEDETGRDVFLPQAPLRRFHLIGLEPGTRAIHLDERMTDYLLGINRMDERVVPLLRPIPPATLPASHRELAETLRLWMESLRGAERRPVLNLTGPAGAGKRAVARSLCEALGVGLHRLDPARLPAPGSDREEMLRLLEREALLLPTAFYLDGGEIDADDRAAAAALEELLERLGVLLIVASPDRWRTERDTFVVRVAKPDAEARTALWREALSGANGVTDERLEDVVHQFELGPQEVSRAVAAARDRARLRDPKGDLELTADDLWNACREQSGGCLDALAQRIVPCYGWDDLVLPEDTLRQLREIAGQVACRARVYDAWGFGARLSRGRGITALFAGPSGTGKTMAAEVMGRDLRLDLYRIDLSSVVSKYIGETEKNLRRVFDRAEQGGAILFFDEADALFGKRTEVKDSHDRYANIEISYLLQRMEDYRGLAILATNLKQNLDAAFLRRLRFLVDFPNPDPAQRQRIWRQVFPPEAEIENLDWTALSRLNIPGGNIRNIALNASFLAAGEGTSVRMDHVLRAARREYAKLSRLISESEFGVYHAEARR